MVLSTDSARHDRFRVIGHLDCASLMGRREFEKQGRRPVAATPQPIPSSRCGHEHYDRCSERPLNQSTTDSL